MAPCRRRSPTETGRTFAQHGIATEGASGGLSVEVVCKAGKGVLGRVCRVDGKFQMVVTHCTVREPSDEELQQRREECGIPSGRMRSLRRSAT